MPIFKLPHDKLIKKAFENPIVAKEFFEEHLPVDVKKILDMNSLKLEKESFVDQALRNSSSDILFSAKFDNNHDGYIFLLLEHQSNPDYWMAFRLFKYMLSIADKYLNEYPESKKLPLIYPLIFFNGKQKYNVSRNLWELFINPELARKFWINDYQLINVHDIPDEELKKNIWAGTLQFFMKKIWQRDMLKVWEDIADLLPELAKVEIGYDHIKLLLIYSLTRIKEDDKINLQNIFTKTLGSEGEKVMASIAQKWYQDGKAEGEKSMASIAQKWYQDGKAEGEKSMASIAQKRYQDGKAEAEKSMASIAQKRYQDGKAEAEKSMASIAQKRYQDGKAEGRTEGRTEGKVDGIKIGEIKGGEKKAIAVARNLLKAQIAIDVITEATGLTKEQVKKLQ